MTTRIVLQGRLTINNDTAETYLETTVYPCSVEYEGRPLSTATEPSRKIHCPVCEMRERIYEAVVSLGIHKDASGVFSALLSEQSEDSIHVDLFLTVPTPCHRIVIPHPIFRQQLPNLEPDCPCHDDNGVTIAELYSE